jgi:hypothetical protein
MLEIGASGPVGREGGNILAYPAERRYTAAAPKSVATRWISSRRLPKLSSRQRRKPFAFS